MLGNGFQSLLDFKIWQAAQKLRFCAKRLARAVSDAPEEIHVGYLIVNRRVVQLRIVLGFAIGIDEGIGHNPIHPSPQIAALGEVPEALVCPQVSVLHQVFRIGIVASETPGIRVKLIHQRLRQPHEISPIRHDFRLGHKHYFYGAGGSVSGGGEGFGGGV